MPRPDPEPTRTARVVDAHHHLWAYNDREYPWMGADMQRLRRDHLPADLAPLLAAAGVDGTVAVQARRTVAETEWLLELSDRHAFLLGVVGWVDFGAQDLDATLERLADHSRLVGVRELIHDMPDPTYAVSDEHVRGIRALARHDLAYDLLLKPPHLPAALELVDAFPHQRFVVDHIAKPDMRRGWRAEAADAWARGVRALAERPHVACKVSGLVTEADWASWSPGQIAPFVDVVLDAFGADRIMIGTDWPVCTLAAGYERTFDLARSFIDDLSPSERADILGGTAVRVYGLDARRIPHEEEQA